MGVQINEKTTFSFWAVLIIISVVGSWYSIKSDMQNFDRRLSAIESNFVLVPKSDAKQSYLYKTVNSTPFISLTER